MRDARTILLIGNYPGDQQESMKRFRLALARDLESAGVEVSHVVPPMVFGRFATDTTGGIGKWMGHIDKYVAFPVVLILLRGLLRATARHRSVIFHICDHSNSPWLIWLPRDRTVITCHDVIAIRGALGHAETHAVPSRSGRILQAWILRRLLGAQFVTCVSKFTRDQLTTLREHEADARNSHATVVVIPNGMNADFTRLDESRRLKALNSVGVPESSTFLLHVGSSHPRKNRRMLVDMITASNDPVRGGVDAVCFAGSPIDSDLRKVIEVADLDVVVLEVPRPNHQQLVALYQSCAAFVFPSYSEGFGWPVIEAQSVGAVVIASDIGPLREVAGDAAIYADPARPRSFASALLRALDSNHVMNASRQGPKNAERFDNKEIILEYVDLYRKIATLANN